MADPAQSPAVATRSRLAARRDRVRGVSIFCRYSLAPVHSRLPVVLVHGMVVSSAFLRPALQLVGNFHRSYAPDLPGYGLSGKPNRTLSIEQQGNFLGDWIESLDLDHPLVVAVSLGTNVATAMAATRPGLVRALILASPTMEPALRSRSQAMLRWLRELPNELRMTPVTARDYVRAGLRRADETFAMALADQIEDRIPRLTMPTLVMRGEGDHLVSEDWARRVTDLLPDGRFESVPGAPHAMNFMTPERFTGHVLRFAADIDAGIPATSREVVAA